MASFPRVFVVVAAIYCLSSVNAVEETVIQVDTLTRSTLSSKASEIFSPSFVTSQSSAQHNVHVYDNSGRFMKLEYSAEHPANTKFLKIDDTEHNSNIVSVDCTGDDTMNVTFIDEDTADYYLNYFTQVSDDSDINSHFIVGSHLWECVNPHTKTFSPILTKVMDVSSSSSSSLIVSVNHVSSYLSIFSNLDMKFSTNMNGDSNTNSDYQATQGPSSILRRRLGWSSWASSAWDDVVDGISEYSDKVDELIDTVKDEIVSSVASSALSSVVTDLSRNVSSTQEWSQNMSGSYLDENNYGKCHECLANFGLTYYYEISVVDGSLKTFRTGGNGPVSMTVDIDIDGDFVDGYNSEYNEMTTEMSVPDLSFTVYGVTLSFKLYGVLSVGVVSSANYVEYGGIITGDIKRGIEYRAEKSNSITYIIEDNLDYSLVGPKLEYSTANLSVYIKPTIYMSLDYVASIYFGLSPEISFAMTENSGTSDCVIDYTPTAKVTSYIGGEMLLSADALPDSVSDKISGIFNISDKISVTQTTLTNLEGCITQSDLTDYEAGTIASSSRRRRRLVEDDTEFAFAVDYTECDTLAYTNPRDVWGKAGNEWWGTLTSFCTDSILLVRVNDDSHNKNHLTGVYQPVFSNYKLTDGNTTDFSCIVRLNFDMTNDSNINSNNKAVFYYTVSVTEFVCLVSDDTLLDTTSDDFMEMISIGTSVSATSAGGNFRTMFLFDVDMNSGYCHTFLLSKVSGYDLESGVNDTDSRRRRLTDTTGTGVTSSDDGDSVWSSVLDYANPGWFGKYYCSDVGMVSVTMYFPESFGNSTSTEEYDITVYMALNYDNDDDNVYDDVPTKYTKLAGSMTWDTGVLSLKSVNETVAFEFNGYLTLLQDSSLWLTGKVGYKGHNCSGIFKGDIDLEEFEVNTGRAAATVNSDDSSDDDDEGNKHKPDHWTVVWGILIGMVVFLVCCGAGVLVATQCMGYSCLCTKNGMNNKQQYQIMEA